jgi:hypothetical protein
MVEREREREESSNDDTSTLASVRSAASETSTRTNVDLLFEKGAYDDWEPAKPPQVLGELLDSRYMLPLHFPSDPRMLAILPGKFMIPDDDRVSSPTIVRSPSSAAVPTMRTPSMRWRSRNRKLREVGVSALKWVDGSASVSRWTRPLPEDDAEYDVVNSASLAGYRDDVTHLQAESHATPLTRKPSGRSKRPSMNEE